MKVLVTDDEPEIRALVRRALERDGHDVTEAGDGPAALRAASGADFDVALLDVALPGMSGLEVLEELRSQHLDVHVIMLTGAAAEADRVLAFVSGADDYVVKPFSVRELAARLLAHERRLHGQRPQVLEAGGLRIDMRARQVDLHGTAVDLTRREFDLLVHLVSNPRRTFSRRELLESVWGSSPDWQSEATVTEHVRRLRAKVEDDPVEPRRIVTVQRAGYRFEPGGEGPFATRANGAASGQEGDGALRGAATVVVVRREIVFADQAAADLVGVADADDLVGRDVYEFIAPTSIAATTARGESIRDGRWPRPELISLLRPDGREVLVEVASRPVSWRGRPANHVSLQDLAGDTAKVRELVTGIRTDVPDAVIVTDGEFRIQSFNPAAEELYGWAERDVIGRPMSDVIPWAVIGEAPSGPDVGAELLREGRWHGQVNQVHRDGTTVCVRASTTLIRDDLGRAVGAVTVNRPIRDEADRDRRADGSTADGWKGGASAADAALLADLRRAIAEESFVLHYQPVVRLEDFARLGYEALVRWPHPTRGLLPPAAFIDLAERSGDIVRLGDLVLRDASRFGVSCPGGHVAVNVSAEQVSDPDFPDRLARILEEMGFPAARLWLEVTETSLVRDLESAKKVLHAVAELGVRIAIDDFGTGWASLTYLREFPVHALKIDRSFVSGVGVDARDTAIVGSILSLGHELDLSVVAEGVETEAQVVHLRAMGCEVAQGFYFAKPRARSELGIT